MKELKQYILESKKTKHTLFPKNQPELEQMIKDEIQKNGIRCSLNHIDVSKVKSMINLFNEGGRGIRFNGDISEWDVSNVVYMNNMFANSIFNGDISEWDVSNVEDASGMFSDSKFDGDLSKWKFKKIKSVYYIFHNSALQKRVHKLQQYGKEYPDVFPTRYQNGKEYKMGHFSGED
jgi:hypothetical protein